MRRHLRQQEQHLVDAEMRHGGLGNGHVRQRDGVVSAAQHAQTSRGRYRCPFAEDDTGLAWRLWVRHVESFPERLNPRHG